MLQQQVAVGRVDQATNGHEALELVKSHNFEDGESPYDLILLDLDMPIMDGFTSCQKLSAFYEQVGSDILSSFNKRHNASRSADQLKRLFNKNAELIERVNMNE